jgi:uncharacterized protein (DUF1501 family)
MSELKNKLSIDRRKFMAASLSVMATMSLSPSALLAADQPNFNLVVIFLRGGFDALSAIAPKGGAEFNNLKARRPGIFYNMDAIAGESFYGVNKELRSLKALLNTKKISAIHGIGGVNESTSHFAQMDYIESGDSKKIHSNGFLAALAYHRKMNAYAIESSVPRLLSPASHQQHYVLQASQPNQLANLARVQGQRLSLNRSEFLTSFFNRGINPRVRDLADTHARRSTEVLDAIKGETVSPGYKNSQLNFIAKLIKSGQKGVFTTSIGGWDHHFNLKSQFTSQTNNLFDDLTKFHHDIQSQIGNTTVVVMSEFGRRVYQNGSLGCDHGRGGIAFVMGGGIIGGKVFRSSKYDANLKKKLADSNHVPSLNLDVAYDIRNLFGEIFNKRLSYSGPKMREELFKNDDKFTFSPGRRLSLFG